jgi:hypothetical protein
MPVPFSHSVSYVYCGIPLSLSVFSSFSFYQGFCKEYKNFSVDIFTIILLLCGWAVLVIFNLVVGVLLLWRQIGQKTWAVWGDILQVKNAPVIFWIQSFLFQHSRSPFDFSCFHNSVLFLTHYSVHEFDVMSLRN